MTSYLVDGILLLALVLTSIRVGKMYRELKRLRALQEGYHNAVDQAAEALARTESAVREINGGGAQILNALGARIDDARGLIAEMEALTRAGGGEERASRMSDPQPSEIVPPRSPGRSAVPQTAEARNAQAAARHETRPATVALALRTASAVAL